LNPLSTIEDCSDRWPVTGIGNDWSRRYYDGPFHLFAAPPDRPAISLVFVQTRDGNTGASNPENLGGGATDKHLLYEGLSRVAADAVLAGASSVGHSVFFTVHHPELVALRLELGLPRHPAQMVMSKDGNFDPGARVFTTPDVPVFLLAGDRCMAKFAHEIAKRPWIAMIPLGDDLPATFARLRRDHGIGRISAVGGRVAATSLVDAGLVQDIYLTTSAIDGGEPNTPWYVGDRPPRLDLIVRKREITDVSPIVFEHFAIGDRFQSPIFSLPQG
jgi:riboflavin biosynthesis pyrimidine reductase